MKSFCHLFIYFSLFIFPYCVQSQSQFNNLVYKGNLFKAKRNYSEALMKYNAAKLLNPEKSKEIDKEIKSIYEEIEREKKEAIKASNRAEEATYNAKLAARKAIRATNNAKLAAIKAIQATNRANALYWASASDQLPPDQALRLLQKAATYASTELPVNERLFLRLNGHDLILANQFDLAQDEQIRSAYFSPTGDYFVTASDENKITVWNYKGDTLKTLDYKDHVFDIKFTSDSSLVISALMDSLSIGSDSTKIAIKQKLERLDLTLSNPKKPVLTTLEKTLPNGQEAAVNQKLLDAISNLTVDQTKSNINKLKIKKRNLTNELSYKDNRLARERRLISQTNTTTQNDSLKRALAEFDSLATSQLTSIKKKIKTCDSTLALYNSIISLINSFQSKKLQNIIVSNKGDVSVTLEKGNTAILWNRKLEAISTISLQEPIKSVFFSPNDSVLVTTTSTNTVLWNTTGKRLSTLRHKRPDTAPSTIKSSVFSPSGNYLATILDDSSATIWPVNLKGDTTCIWLKSPTNEIYFSQDDSLLVTTSYDSTAKLWDIHGNLMVTLKKSRSGDEAVTTTSVSISADSHLILTTYDDGSTQLWEKNGSPLVTLSTDNNIRSATFSPNKKQILTLSSLSNETKVWELIGNNTVILNHKASVFYACASPDNSLLVTASGDGLARVWKRGELKVTLRHKGQISSANFSPDGKHIITSSWDGSAKIWDTSGKLLHTLPHKSIVNSARFSTDGKTIVTTSNDTLVTIWTANAEKVREIPNIGSRVYWADYSPDNKLLIAALENGEAKVIDTTGRDIDILKHQGAVVYACFSPDGKHKATASWDNTARLWPANINESIMLTHSGPVTSVGFSPDGRMLVTSSLDGKAKVWDLKGNTIATLQHTSPVFSSTFSPDGNHILTTTWDGTVKVWVTPKGGLEWLKAQTKIPQLSEENKRRFEIKDSVKN